jgi:predicted metal-dependent enzyme (double-stranded beta helix superfamily)
MLDWILDPDGAGQAAVFEETVAAFLRGVAVPLDEEHGMTVATPSDALEQIRARAGELLAHDHWSRAEVIAYQRQRLQELLRHAVAHSP